MLINQDFIPAELRAEVEHCLASELEAANSYDKWGDQETLEALYRTQAETGQVWKRIAESLLIQLTTKKYGGYESWLETLSANQKERMQFWVKQLAQYQAAADKHFKANNTEAWEKANSSRATCYTTIALNLIFILGIQDCLPSWVFPLESALDNVLNS